MSFNLIELLIDQIPYILYHLLALPMDNAFSLYIDHQSVAPLVRLLENTVESCRSQQEGEYQPYEIRMTLYQEFLSILHNLYLSKYPDLKFENGIIKLENQPEAQDVLKQTPQIEGLMTVLNSQTPPKKQFSSGLRTRGVSAKSLQVEVQLIQWIKSCDKRIFEKKEIDAKYHELVGDQKKTITLKKIKELVEKFNLPALIVKTRNKEEHFFGVDLNASTSTVVKKEENSLNMSVWLDDDDETIKNLISSYPQEIKEEYQPLDQSLETKSEQIDSANISSCKIQVMAQQSCSSISLEEKNEE